MLRGHRDFESHGAMADFLQEVADQRNSARQKRLAKELEVLHSLPQRRLASFTKERGRVNTGIPRRLITPRWRH